jgi:uncharacterized membrane protein
MSGPSEAGSPRPQSGVKNDLSARPSDDPPHDSNANGPAHRELISSEPAAPATDAAVNATDAAVNATDAAVNANATDPAANATDAAVNATDAAVNATDAAVNANATHVEAVAPPIAPSHTVARDGLLVHGSRIVVLASLLGGAIAFWTQLAFRSPWLDAFLLDNELEPGKRASLLLVLVSGILIGGLVALGGIELWRRRARPIVELEQWAWFLSPLLMLPLGPVLFRPKVWMGRHDVLLPSLVLILLVFEQLAFRCLTNVPPAAQAWWLEAVEQVPARVRKQGSLVVVIAAAAVFSAFFIFYTLRWHYKLRTGNYDLSINNNLMYGGLHGEFLHSPLVFPKEPAKYLANHVKLGAYLFLPIYAIFPRPETLFVIQSTFIGFGAVPLYLFARRHVSEWTAAIVALAYLSYYPLHGASFSEFQAVPVAALFIFVIIWAADTERYKVLAFALVCALLMREDVSVGLAVLGAFYLLTGYRPLPGLVIALISTVYFLLLRFYVMDAAGSWWFPNMYKELWADGEKGFRSVIKTMLTNPMFTLSKIIVEKKLIYLLHLLTPIVFLPARRWYLWAAFLPGAFLTLLVTNYDPPITYSFHYVMHWAPYLFAASVVALAAIRKAPDFGLERYRAAIAALVASTIVLSYNYGAFPRREGSFKAGFSKIEFSFSEDEWNRYQELLEITSIIPKDASVAATEKCGPHLSSRLNMFTMRQGPQTAEWIVASARELKLSKTRPTLKEALESGKYGVVKRLDDFAVMKLGAPTDENQALLDDWEL